MRPTKKAYEEYLNELTPDFESDEWIIGGKNRNYLYPKYGKAIKLHDPQGFQAGYNDWKREQQARERRVKG